MKENLRRKFKISSYIENLDDAGLSSGDVEKTETLPEGTLEISDGKIRIFYEERGEGGEVKTEIVADGGGVTVARRGAINNVMHFVEGERHESLYEIPPYSFDTAVYTRKIRNSVSESGGRIEIFYTMTIGGQIKNVRMKIEV